MSSAPTLIEFPAVSHSELLGTPFEVRSDAEGEGWQTRGTSPPVGVDARGRGPGDTPSLPYFAVSEPDAALERMRALGGSVVHPGTRRAICKNSERTPFGLTLEATNPEPDPGDG